MKKMEKKFRYQQQMKAKAEVRKKKARELYAAGHTWVEIGRLFGVTPQRAQQLGKKK
jgi:hypothetical protein